MDSCSPKILKEAGKIGILLILAVLFLCGNSLAEDQLLRGAGAQPIIVNGDNVEYSTDSQEVTARGNVEIVYADAKLTCRKLVVNTRTKEGVAEGNARIEDASGVIEGEKINYNFQAKTGTIEDAGFRANPFFGKARKVERLSETEYTARYGYFTTCSLDRPHYRISSKQMDVLPGDKINTRDDTLYLGGFPILYLPRFTHTMEDPLMHVRVMPGKSKDWGLYTLSAWKYNLNNFADGRVYLDYRDKLGWAEGFGLNYNTTYAGKGDFKFYYTDEKPQDLPATSPRSRYQRYLARWRHKWVIDEQTNFISEFYKIGDQKRKYMDPTLDFLKDYFFREYEKDTQPLTYALFHHSFSYSSLDLLAQKRVNNWYNQMDMLPELTYTLPSLRLGDSRLYLSDESVFANFIRKNSAAPLTANNIDTKRFSTVNRLSLPMKILFVEFTPFLKNQEVIYNKDLTGKSLPVNTIFYAGADMSTKFYRVFKVKSNFLGLGIDSLRHVITPTVGYSYNHAPTIVSSKLPQIDSVDAITSSNAAALALSNKIQAKRNGASVDLVDFRITTNYAFSPQFVSGYKKGGGLSDFLFKLKLLPYSWMRFEGDATYKHSGVPTDADYCNYNHFSQANYDINFDLGSERSFGIGQRYQRKGGNQLTTGFNWRFNPKWRFSIYERYNLKSFTDSSNAFIRRGSLEQEYTLSRDLHCWDVNLTLNTKKNEGSNIFIIFRLKAFPEAELSINQGYNKPKSGAQ